MNRHFIELDQTSKEVSDIKNNFNWNKFKKSLER